MNERPPASNARRSLGLALDERRMAAPYHPRPEKRRWKRRVSKGAPERANGASFWIILRHAMLRIAAQDEGSSSVASA
jgi:hypothetical protein